MSDEKPAQEIPAQQPAEPVAAPTQQEIPTKPEPIAPTEQPAPQNEESQEKPPQDKPTEKKKPKSATPKKLSPREKPADQTIEETTSPRKPKVYRGPPPRKNMVISPMKEKDWKGNGKSIFLILMM